jgi:hypothetical protein
MFVFGTLSGHLPPVTEADERFAMLLRKYI